MKKYNRVYLVVHHHPTSATMWARNMFDDGMDDEWMISLPCVPLALFHVDAWESFSAEPLLAGLYHHEAFQSDMQEGVGRNVMQMYNECPSKSGGEVGGEVSSTRMGQGATPLASLGFVFCPQREYNVTTYRRDTMSDGAQAQLFQRALAYSLQVAQHTR